LSEWPDWWEWELAFTGHAELRMGQRGVTEVDVRTMLHEATAYSPSVAEGRFLIQTTRSNRPWVVVVEPDGQERKLVIVTTYENLQ
jgi:hypothetical protein